MNYNYFSQNFSKIIYLIYYKVIIQNKHLLKNIYLFFTQNFNPVIFGCSNTFLSNKLHFIIYYIKHRRFRKGGLSKLGPLPKKLLTAVGCTWRGPAPIPIVYKIYNNNLKVYLKNSKTNKKKS